MSAKLEPQSHKLERRKTKEVSSAERRSRCRAASGCECSRFGCKDVHRHSFPVDNEESDHREEYASGEGEKNERRDQGVEGEADPRLLNELCAQNLISPSILNIVSRRPSWELEGTEEREEAKETTHRARPTHKERLAHGASETSEKRRQVALGFSIEA